MLPEENIPEILSLMRTVDHINRNEHIWKGDTAFAADAAHYNSLIENIFSFMTDEEKNKILDLYRFHLQRENKA